MSIKDMIQKKREYGYSYDMIAKETGIPLSTIQKIFSGQTKSPRYDTMNTLEEFFREKKDILAETSAYNLDKKQGDYTVEDYYMLPEDQRYELIDGVLIEMEGPKFIHQAIAGELYRLVANYIRSQKGKCVPFIAPVDVQLDQDDKTMVQPDVGIICDRDLISERGIYGAPDWLVEVLSPSTKRKDCIKKLDKYMEAGVQEYWIVDPMNQTVTVYDFAHEQFPMNYTFEDQVPLGIYDGKTSIDMKEVWEYAKDFA